MLLIVDVETSFQITQDGKKDPSPFNIENKLVSVGINDNYWFLAHDELDKQYLSEHAFGTKLAIQAELDKATLIVGHNIKFDIMWLLETGFTIPDVPLWDTMICEYVMARGLKPGLSLDACLQRRGLELKNPIIKEYMDKNISFEAIPIDVVELYGRQDVTQTAALYKRQQEELQKPEDAVLLNTIKMTNEFLKVVIEMERNGTCIDVPKLEQLEQDTKFKLQQMEHDLQTLVTKVMGDTKINLNSPEDLSKVLYSRYVPKKDTWAEIFNIGTEQRGAVKKRKKTTTMSNAKFVDAVRNHTALVYKTRAEQCETCGGRGRVPLILKNGKPGKAIRICQPCDGEGIIYVKLPEIAGLRIIPPSFNFVAAGGFKTDSDTVKLLLPAVRTQDAREFLEKLIQVNTLSSYVSSFIEGVKKNIRADGCVHAQFRQTVTATGRLSSSDPNWQNLPRGLTFPIRGVLRSRWDDGCLLEWDAAQLEFRVAAELSGDEQALEDILNNVDVHTNTAKALTEAGQPTSRQDAKPHTFKPLYGGTSGTAAEQAYYTWFLQRYKGIDTWHKRLQAAAIHPGTIRLPSGREYRFPNVKRLWNGNVTFSTQIKNYPVQGYATGDIVPMLTIAVAKEMKKAAVKSLLINEVHDSNIKDIYPGELNMMIKLVKDTLANWQDILCSFGLPVFKVPLAFEIKTGKHLLDMRVV